MKTINENLLRRFRADCASDGRIRALSAAMSKTDMNDLAYLPMNAAKLDGPFSIELKTRGITAQRQSGRCWMFAVMNILREKVAENCNLDSFELSGNYLAFYDKLEKANNMLEMVIENAALPLLDRKMEYILKGFTDGGYWDMGVDLVRKYGVVPKSVMPENYQSEHTERFRTLLLTLVRKDAAELRSLIAAGGDPYPRKEEMMAEIYRLECIVYGQPPETFDFSFRDSDGMYRVDRGLTPQEFYAKYIGIDLDAYITVTNHPTDGLPADLYYKFHYIGSMAEGDILNLNLRQEELEALCIAQLKAGEPVWFGCDCHAYGSRKDGVWDPDTLCYEDILGGVDLSLGKRERLQYRDSYANHAMLLVGVNLGPDGRPDRWKIENSWGDEAGKKGYFVCSEKYFREFVYEAIIRRDLLSDAQRALLAGEPKEINAWESDCL